MTSDSVLADHRFAAVSVHTSGQCPPEIVELSVVTIDRAAVSSTPLSWLVRPTRPVTCHAVRGYGIRIDELPGRPPFAAVADDVAGVLDGRWLVAHGARVVADALHAELPGLNPPAVLDTLPLVHRVWPCAAPGSLPELVGRARLRLPGPVTGTAWRARATAGLFLYLADRLAGTLPDLTAERLGRIAARYRHRSVRPAR